jgi:NitT/TauT family transport system substrate-binding protein
VAASFQFDVRGMMTHDDVQNLAGVQDETILVSSAGDTAWWPCLKK